MSTDVVERARQARRGLLALALLDDAMIGLQWSMRWPSGFIVPYSDDVESLRKDFEKVLRP